MAKYRTVRYAIEGDLYFLLEKRFWGLWWRRVKDQSGRAMIFWTEDRAIEYGEKLAKR